MSDLPMKKYHWHIKQRRDVHDRAVDEFIADILAVCAKHRKTIGHEDIHGAFIIEGPSASNEEWLRSANIDT